jgi:ferrous iron transport protein B
MLWSIYMIGLVLAVLLAKLLRSTLFKGESVPFVMELPPYRLPTLRGVLTQMWQRAWLYLKKAGTIILAISIVLWALTTFPGLPEQSAVGFSERREALAALETGEEERKERAEELDNEEAEATLRASYAGRVGQAMEPFLRPMGFDWRIGTALIGAFAAKEVFVAQLGIVYSLGEADEESAPLREQLRESHSPLVGFCIMLFCLISAPCMATIAITHRESNSWRWALFQLGGLTLLAYVLTVLVYQAGSLLGVGLN